MKNTGKQSCHMNRISSVPSRWFQFWSNFWYSSESESSTLHDVMDNLFIHVIYFVVYSLSLSLFSSPTMVACFKNSCKCWTGFSFSASHIHHPSRHIQHTCILNSTLFRFDTQKWKKKTHLCEFHHFILDGWTDDWKMKFIPKIVPTLLRYMYLYIKMNNFRVYINFARTKHPLLCLKI